MADSPATCGRKPNPGRKSCGVKNIRIRVDGAAENNNFARASHFFLNLDMVLQLQKSSLVFDKVSQLE